MKVFLSADIEGTAGITAFNEGDRTTPDWIEFRHLMTQEVIAACEGAHQAGAAEIVIKDAHHTGRNIILDELRSTRPHRTEAGASILRTHAGGSHLRCSHLHRLSRQGRR